jgi:hypothetical protein
MKQPDISNYRLHNQGVSNRRFKTPFDVVKNLGAVQAQDYLGALWAIGLRMKNAKEADIEKAIIDRSIVRSWPMRGTLHFVPAQDLRWMLKLLTPRVFHRAAGIYKEAGLDAKMLLKSKKILSSALQDGKILTRNEMYETLGKSGISIADQRGLHILGYLAQEGLICFGPRKGKQQTFVLLDEWIPSSNMLTRDQSLARLALTYFTGHGPATIHDFSWWSGLTIAEVKEAIEMIGSQLQQERVDDVTYWMSGAANPVKPRDTLFLLPAYDEFLVAYKDRNAAFKPKNRDLLKTYRNAIFGPTIIHNGYITGTWNRSFMKNEVAIKIDLLKSYKSVQHQITIALNQYEKFVGMPARITF